MTIVLLTHTPFPFSPQNFAPKIDGEELHSQVLADFSVDEIHKLVYSLGFNRKSDEQLAEETQQNLKQVRPKIKNPVFSPLI